MINKVELLFYNNFFKKKDKITLIRRFLNSEDHQFINGVIAVDTIRGSIEFRIEIPKEYPLKDIKFFANDFIGYPHQNYNGDLCLNTPFINHLYTRLNLDFERLISYINKYYINEYEDKHYEYPQYFVSGNVTIKKVDGTTEKRSKVTAFCRCGNSNNKPYCDGSHIKSEFKD